MPRNYANVFTAIWARDGEFVKRSGEAQRIYMMLFTQGEISACGLLPLRRRRWVTNSSDGDESALNLALKELEEHRYIVVDEDTEEVLVRSFTNHDNGYANPRRLPSIRDAASAVESPRLLRVLAEEFERLGVPTQWRGKASTEWLSIGKTGTPDSPAEDDENSTLMHDARHNAYQNSDANDEALFEANTLGNGYAIANDASTECLTDSRRRVPQPTTHNPQPVSTRRGATNASPPKAKRGHRIPDDFTVTPAMVEWARGKTPHVNGRLETEKFINHWQAASGRTATKVNWAAAWRNWMLNSIDRYPPPGKAAATRGGFQVYRNPDTPNAYAGYEMKGGPDAA
jgi:hypothetical protein